MSFASLCKRSFGLTLTVLLLSFLLIGCQNAAPDHSSAMVSAKGVKLESFMPSDSLALVALGTDDAQQKEMLGKLWSNFPQDQAKQFIDSLFTELNKSLQEQGYSFEKDVWPIIANDQRMMLSVSGEMTKEKMPNLIVAIPLSAVDKAQTLLDNEATKGTYEKQTYKDATIYVQKGSNTFITMQNDVLLLSNSMATLQQSLDNQNGNNLLANAEYEKNVQGIPKNVMFFYMDVQQYLKKAIALAQESGATQVQIDDETMNKFFNSESGVAIAEADGIRLKGNIFSNSKDNFLKDVYKGGDLSAKVPGKNVALFASGNSMISIINLEATLYKNMEGFSDVGKNIRSFFSMQGLDVDTDIVPFMDKSYAFVIGKSNGLMPWAGLYMDVSSQPAGAKKFMSFVFRGLDSFVTQGKEDSGLANVIEHKKLESTDGGEWYQLLAKLDQVPDFQKAPGNEVIDEPMSLKYGVNKENMASMVLAPDSVLNSTDHLDKDQLFQQMKGKLSGIDGGVTYLNVSLVNDYLHQLVDFGAKNGNTSQDDVDEFNMVMGYVQPVKAMIFSAKLVSDMQVQSEGFILIQK